MNIRTILFIAITLANFGINELYAMDTVEAATEKLWAIMKREGLNPYTPKELAEAQQAIDNGADIERVLDDFDPLHLTAAYRQEHLVDFLLKAGVDLNKPRGKMEHTLLMWFQRIATMPIFLQLAVGTNLNHQDANGNTLLHHAGDYVPLEVMKQQICCLLFYGADTTIRNHSNYLACEKCIHGLIGGLIYDPFCDANRAPLKRELSTQGKEHPAYKEFLDSKPFQDHQDEMCRKHGLSFDMLLGAGEEASL